MPVFQFLMKIVITLTIATLLFAPSGIGQKRKDTKSAPASKDDQILFDLRGIWVTSEGEEVDLDCPSCPLQGQAVLGGPPMTNSSITAKFTGGGACKFGGQRKTFIDGKLAGKKLTGTMWRCTESESLFKDCHVASVYTTTFKANVISKDEIYGYRRSEWYGPANLGACKFQRDPSGDKDVAFGLTRKQPTAGNSKHNPHCPETNDLRLYKNVSTRATKMINFVAHFARDEKIQGVLEQSSDTLEKISGGLEKIIDAEEKCEKIAQLVEDLKEFQEALDQINNAGCNTQKLAAGFDQLFRSAGKLGSRISYFPALNPLFQILAQNQNFFAKVSGAMDPEQRWASQFQNVDGYIPNCPAG